MAGYNTKQQERLWDCLARNADRPLTIEETLDDIRRESGTSPGKSTAFRLMTKWVQEGRVLRTVSGRGRRFVYQLAGCGNLPPHLHLKCVDCGRLIHLDSAESEALLRRIRDSSGFQVDEERTILFGRCSRHRGESCL